MVQICQKVVTIFYTYSILINGVPDILNISAFPQKDVGYYSTTRVRVAQDCFIALGHHGQIRTNDLSAVDEFENEKIINQFVKIIISCDKCSDRVFKNNKRYHICSVIRSSNVNRSL